MPFSRIKTITVFAIVFALVVSSAGFGWCALTSYLRLEGNNQGVIEGECTQKGYEKWILVYGVKSQMEVPRDQHTGLPTGQRIHHPLTIIKSVDSSSPLICQALVSGERIKKFQLNFHRINEQGEEELYYTIELKNALIVDYQLTKLNMKEEAFKNYPDMEEVSFTFESITWSHKKANREATDSLNGSAN